MNVTYEIGRCPSCDRADDEEIADREEILREVEDLWEFHLRRLRPGTPERFLADRVVFSQDPPLRLGRCRACGTLYRNPRERGRELGEMYAEEPLDPAVLQGLFETQRESYRTQAARLVQAAGRGGVGLEVGSYVGAFLAAARDAGWSFEGVDVNQAANRFSEGLGFRVHDGTLESVPEERRYGAVAIWNCFDQLARPRATLRAARARLQDGGLLALRVPNGAFYAALRPRLRGPLAGVTRALLAHNNLLGFPYRYGFNPGALAALLHEEGFQTISVVGDTLVPIADRWTRRWAEWEERAVKLLLRAVVSESAAPWFEIYARAVPRPAQA